VWLDQERWPEGLYDRLLAQRIVMAHGYLDGEAATRLCAQLLTLDAEGTRPIRLELQNLDAELSAVLSVMGVLDVVRGPVSAYAGGRIQGPALDPGGIPAPMGLPERAVRSVRAPGQLRRHGDRRRGTGGAGPRHAR